MAGSLHSLPEVAETANSENDGGLIGNKVDPPDSPIESLSALKKPVNPAFQQEAKPPVAGGNHTIGLSSFANPHHQSLIFDQVLLLGCRSLSDFANHILKFRLLPRILNFAIL